MAKKKKKQYNSSVARHTQAKKVKSKKYNLTGIYLAVVIILTFLVYSNSFKGEFLNWDDNVYITNSELIKDLSNDGIKKMFTEYHNSNYHPLTTLSFAIQYKASDGSPRLFHVINLIFHILNCLLVYYLIILISKRKIFAFLVSLFFGIHPMHVESVAWISEHKDLLYTFFYLLALICYVLYINNTRRIHFLVFSFILITFSMFSKSAAVVFPLVLILFDYYYKRKVSIGLILEKIPFFAVSVFFGIMAVYSQSSDSSLDMLDYSLLDRLFLAAYALIFYIFKLFVPSGLSAMHYYPLKTGDFLPFGYYMAPLLILLIIYLVYRSGRFKKELIFGFIFYLINLLLVIQIIPVGRAIVAERYTYVPYIGLFYIIGQFLVKVLDNKFSFAKRIKTALIAILVIYCLIFTFTAWSRTSVWKNSSTLLNDIIKKYPDRGFAYYARGNIKVNKQDPNGAFSDYNKAIELDANLPNAYHSRALLQYTLHNNPAAAMNDYNKAIELNPEFTMAYNDRGSLKYRMGDYQGALKDYNIAIERKPEYYLAIKNCGLAKYQLKDYEGAINNFNRVLELQPDYSEVYYFRGYAKLDTGDEAGACDDWRKALEMGYTKAKQKVDENCGEIIN